DVQAFRRHTAMPESEVREALARIHAPLRVPPQSAISLWHTAYDGPADQGIEVVVPLVTKDGATGIGLLVRVTLSEHGTYQPQAVRFVEALPSEEELAAYERATSPAPPQRDTSLPEEGLRPVPARWRPVLADVVRRLVVGDYSGLVRDGIAPARTS